MVTHVLLAMRVSLSPSLFLDVFRREIERPEDALEALDEAVLFKEDKNVAWQTLDAFVKEQLNEGVNLPLELFGVYHQKIAKIKR